jgi:hypothetical protein
MVEGESLGTFTSVKDWIYSELKIQLEKKEDKSVTISRDDSGNSSSVIVYLKKAYARINEGNL